MYDSDGQFVLSFGEERIKHAEGITATNGGRVVLVGTYFSYVHVFSGQGEHLFKFTLKVERYYLCLDVAFHWPSERILLAGKEEGNENLRVMIYSKDGEFLREIVCHFKRLYPENHFQIFAPSLRILLTAVCFFTFIHTDAFQNFAF